MRIVCKDGCGRQIYASRIGIINEFEEEKLNEGDLKKLFDGLYQYLICIYEQINIQNVEQAVIYIENSNGKKTFICENPNDDFDDWKWIQYEK